MSVTRIGRARWRAAGPLALTLYVLGGPLRAQEMIVNSGVSTKAITTNEAQLYLTSRLKEWPNGVPVKVFVLPDNNPLHRRLANAVFDENLEWTLLGDDVPGRLRATGVQWIGSLWYSGLQERLRLGVSGLVASADSLSTRENDPADLVPDWDLFALQIAVRF